jgi:VIT1/CCC1 family predicted Fe2+/Mn2+ transporter
MAEAEERSLARTPEVIRSVTALQRGEITEYHIYRRLAPSVKDSHNREILLRMADEELSHYRIWKKYTGKDIAPDSFRLHAYYLAARLFGLTFAIKLMERGEARAVQAYREIARVVPEAELILHDEEEHEMAIIGMLDEKSLRYVGSIVLGINDALVEFTGSLAGFTFALQDATIIAAVGLIMGIAAALSMGSSEYLSQKSEQSTNNPVTAALYTGGAYLATVIVLILPFLLMENPFAAFAVSLTAAILIIVVFTFYTAVAKDLPFWRRFAEMAAISLGIAAISFLIGILIRTYLNVQI